MRYLVRSNGNGLESGLEKWMDDVFSTLPGWDQHRFAVDVRELEDRYVLEAEMPGLTDADVEIRVENDLLTIRGTAPDRDHQNDKFVLRERSHRNYERSFAIPRNVDRERIEARFKNGILTLDLHKAEEAKPRTIKVKGE